MGAGLALAVKARRGRRAVQPVMAIPSEHAPDEPEVLIHTVGEELLAVDLCGVDEVPARLHPGVRLAAMVHHLGAVTRPAEGAVPRDRVHAVVLWHLLLNAGCEALLDFRKSLPHTSGAMRWSKRATLAADLAWRLLSIDPDNVSVGVKLCRIVYSVGGAASGENVRGRRLLLFRQVLDCEPLELRVSDVAG